VGAVLLSVVAALAFTVLVGALSVSYHLVRQQGHIILRVEALEQRLAQVQQSAQPHGLEVGSSFPGFDLPDFTGLPASLEDLPAKQLVVVSWDPGCDACERSAPELARLSEPLGEREVDLNLVAQGDVESNRRFTEEHGLDYTVLLQDGSPPVAAFAGLDTPAAYLLDEHRRVSRPVAAGCPPVLEIVTRVARVRGKEVRGERTLAPA
jgi:peroxiredoxin